MCVDTKNQNYKGIDLFKFLFALCVVACHINPYDTQVTGLFQARVFLNTLLYSAVPFFFIANGFFLAKRIKTPFEAHENFFTFLQIAKKYLRLFLLWTVVYLPITVYYYIVSNSSPLAIVYNFVDGLFLQGSIGSLGICSTCVRLYGRWR